MFAQLSNGAGRANGPRSWNLVSMGEVRTQAGAGSVAACRDALKRMDTAAQISVGPAGVAERWIGLQSADQTPAGGGGESAAQVQLRSLSVVGMAFSPKGSFTRTTGTAAQAKRR